MKVAFQSESYAPVAGRVCDPRAHLKDDRGVLRLNGTWGFRWSESDPSYGLDPGEPAPCPPSPMPETIDVPSHWVLRGGGRWGAPCYTNVVFPFPVCPPFPPQDNPTGDYHRRFELPASWDLEGGRVRLRFEGAESMLRVWVNAQWIGMATGSRLAHEFDITDSLRAGGNELIVRVSQYSSGSYLEDQDQWWLPGLFRDVELRYLRFGDIEDLWIRGDYDPVGGRGSLEVEARLCEGPGAPPASVGFGLRIDEGGARVLDLVRGGDGRYASAPLDVGGVEPWSPDAPRLYGIGVAPIGNPGAARSLAIGFTRVEIVEGQLRANGEPLKLNGVNRHEIRADEGRVFDEAWARRDFALMKSLGVNAIRTSHYPPHPRLLDLADEIGLWVMLEGDIETHGFEGEGEWESNPTADPRWRGAFLDRTMRAFERDKNHPSIFCWSLGNESGTGANMAEAARRLRARAGARALLHYEGDHALEYTDIYSRMYPTLEEVRAVLEAADPGAPVAVEGHPASRVSAEARARIRRAPYLMCEYLHAMGTGPGGARDYAALMGHPRHAGGFVWEWRDHALWQDTDSGRRLAYGGDFGEAVHDGSFVCDGLVSADSRIYAGTYAWARAMAPEAPALSAGPAGQGEGAARLRATAERIEDVRVESGRERFFVLDEAGGLVRVGDMGFGPVVLSAFRAPTDNDRGRGPVDYWGLREGREGELGAGLNERGVSHAQRWKAAGLHLLSRRLLAIEDMGGGAVRVRERWAPPSVLFGLESEAVYSPLVLDEGAGVRRGVRVRVSLRPEGRWPERIPRLGVRFELPGVGWGAQWLGERDIAYPDMPGGHPHSYTRAEVAELWERGVRPQEGGHRPSLEVLRLESSAQGSAPRRRLDLVAVGEIGWSACEWNELELDAAGHWEDLPKSERTYLWLDALHEGIGSRSCGPDVRPRYAARMQPCAIECLLVPSWVRPEGANVTR